MTVNVTEPAMKRRHLRHLILIGAAVSLVLLARAYVLGGYRIPTDSMAPTFLGDPASGDRVLVDKTRFMRRAPERWMLAVFRRPGDERTYVKRLVGLPGDDLLIRDGDLYNQGTLLIKPDAVQDEVLVPVYDEVTPFPQFESFWYVTSGHMRTTSDGLELQPGADEAAVFQTRDEITDGHLDREGRLCPGREPVGDHEIRIRFTLAARARRLEVGLDCRWDRIRVRLGIGTAGRITQGERLDREVPGLSAVPGQEHVLVVTHVDRRLRVRLDGVDRFRFDRHPAHPATTTPERHNRLEVSVFGDTLRVGALRVRRDLHFTREGEHATGRPIRIAPGCYFLLGDNSGRSVDSREWGAIPGGGLIGEPVLIFWPPGRIRLF